MCNFKDCSSSIKGMNLKYDKDDFVITIPKDILVYAAENHPEYPLKFTSEEGKKNFFRFIMHNFASLGDDRKSEESFFMNFLDSLFTELYENPRQGIAYIDLETGKWKEED